MGTLCDFQTTMEVYYTATMVINTQHHRDRTHLGNRRMARAVSSQPGDAAGHMTSCSESGVGGTSCLDSNSFTTFICRAFSECFFIKSDLQYSTFVGWKRNNTVLCRYSEDVHRTKRQALTITRLTRSLYTTIDSQGKTPHNAKYYFVCQDVQHTISAYIHNALFRTVKARISAKELQTVGLV